MQYLMFQNTRPEGTLQCPCGATSEYTTLQNIGHRGWLIPSLHTHHFEYEGQSLIGLCQDCHLANGSESYHKMLRRRDELWCIEQPEGTSTVRWLADLAKKGFALGDAEEEVKRQHEYELWQDGDWRHPEL